MRVIEVGQRWIGMGRGSMESVSPFWISLDLQMEMEVRGEEQKK